MNNNGDNLDAYTDKVELAITDLNTILSKFKIPGEKVIKNAIYKISKTYKIKQSTIRQIAYLPQK